MPGIGFWPCGCHCAGCDVVGHCVTVEWDLEFLDFFVGCNDPRVFNAASGSATFYFDPDDQTLSKLVCLNGTPIADDTAYKTASVDQSWDIPSGASYPLVISGAINASPVCFGMQVLLGSEFNTGLEWTPGAFDGSYQELTEDLSINPPCTADEVSIRGTITMTDTFPATAEDCGCP
jgi:hypothetical protein